MDTLEERLARLSPAKRALLERQLREEGENSVRHVATSAKKNVEAPLSFSQELLWNIEQSAPGLATYNVPRAILIEGNLQIDFLQAALNQIVERHEALRTRFFIHEGLLQQRVQLAQPVAFEVHDLRDAEENDRDVARDALLCDAMRYPFDLSRDQLFRATLVRTNDTVYALALVWHHIVSDEAAAPLIFRDLAYFYDVASGKEKAALPPIGISYTEFACRQREHWNTTRVDTLVEEWARALTGFEPSLALPTDFPPLRTPSFEGKRTTFRLPTAVAQSVQNLARKSGATVFITLLAAFQALLARYTGQSEILVGSVFSGRGSRELDETLGYFSCVLPLLAHCNTAASFAALLENVRDGYLFASERVALPFEALVTEFAEKGFFKQLPVLQAMFTMLPEAAAVPGLSDCRVQPLVIDRGISKLDLMMGAVQKPDGLHLTVEYRSELFSAATIERFVAHYGQLLEVVCANPDIPLGMIPLQTPAERELEQTWNDTARPLRETMTIVDLLRAQALRTPHAVAVSCGAATLTYAQLEARADALALQLCARGVERNALVGICLERSVDMLVAVFAVHRAGAAYLPLDPAVPPERAAFMLADTGSTFVITEEALRQRLPASCTTYLLDAESIDAVHCEDTNGNNQPRFPVLADAGDLAYVIFTSGSTGLPKGVAVEHRSLVNLVEGMQSYLHLHPGDRFVSVAPLAFDMSVADIFLPLSYGAELIIAPRATVQDSHELAALFAVKQPTLMEATPSTWRMLIEAGWQGSEDFRIISGGEALSETLATQLHARGQLWNIYGPTEATVWATIERLHAHDPITIGRPMPNVATYVLDEHQQALPPGIIGELYIGGIGVARGYVQRPELTAERFVADPFCTRAGGRMYRTGDLVRRRADGTIAYVGRADFQVKVRGYRIELDEITNALVAQNGVMTAATLVVGEDEAQRLVAFYVASGDIADDAEYERNLARQLAKNLPQYMIPSTFVRLTQLPLNANGKLDRKALLAAVEPVLERVSEAALPTTATQHRLLDIWSQVLRRAGFGIHDNFFDLGGNSILAMRVLHRTSSVFGLRLTLRAFFAAPTIAELGALIDLPEREAKPLERIPVRASSRVPLSAAQQVLWLLNRSGVDAGAYNVRAARRVSGSLHIATLQHVLDRLVERHSALRIRIFADGHSVTQYAGPAESVAVTQIDLAHLSPADQDAELQRHVQSYGRTAFDLMQDLLLRAMVLRLSENEHIVLLLTHHIVCDGASLEILFAECAHGYNAALRGETPIQAETAIEYLDFVAWQNTRLAGRHGEDTESYWQGQLHGATSALALPVKADRSDTGFEGRHAVHHLDAAMLRKLKHLARKAHVTLADLCLAAFGTVIGRYSGQDDLLIGVPFEGRALPEVESLIGYFVNTVPIRFRFTPELTFAQLLRTTHETVLEAQEYQDVPPEFLKKIVDHERYGGQGIFRVAYMFGTASIERPFGDGVLAPVTFESGLAKFGLMLSVTEQAEGLRLSLEYRSDDFDPAVIARFFGHYRMILQSAADDIDAPVALLPLLTEEEVAVHASWNATARSFDQTATLISLLRAQAHKNPDSIAVQAAGDALTYRDLEARANQVAAVLRTRGVGRGECVGIFVERSVEMYVAVLAVHRADAAYVPLDPSYPVERIAYMLQDAQVRVVVTEESLKASLPKNIVCLSLDASAAEIAAESSEPLESHIDSSDVSHIIYTSGSTGRPKGVLVTHRNVVNFIIGLEQPLAIGPKDVILGVASLAFDLSCFELFAGLARGARVVLATRQELVDIHALGRLLQATHPTLMLSTPSHWRMLIDAGYRPNADMQVITAGEPISVSLAEALARYGKQYWNASGPTETTIINTLQPHQPGSPLTVGKPMANVTAHILDARRQPLPIGVAGELYCGGECVTAGYLHQDTLTHEKYIEDPFADTPGARLYRTGDLAYRHEDGTLEILGRLDFQVKIRGFRVELGEIDATLVRHADVHEAICTLRRDVGIEPMIVAYIVPHAMPASAQDFVASIKAHLRLSLPEYAVPTRYMLMEALPISGNKKIDRAALPKPPTALDERREYLAPRDPLQREVAALFMQLLGLERVGLHDNFFELGGHSLLALRLIIALTERFTVAPSLAFLFDGGTVEGIACEIERLLAKMVSAQPEFDDELMAELANVSDEEAYALLQADTNS